MSSSRHWAASYHHSAWVAMWSAVGQLHVLRTDGASMLALQFLVMDVKHLTRDAELARSLTADADALERRAVAA